MTLLISLLVWLIIACVILYVARLVISGLSVPQPFANIFYALVILILLCVFMSEIGWVGPVHGWRTWR